MDKLKTAPLLFDVKARCLIDGQQFEHYTPGPRLVVPPLIVNGPKGDENTQHWDRLRFVQNLKMSLLRILSSPFG